MRALSPLALAGLLLLASGCTPRGASGSGDAGDAGSALSASRADAGKVAAKDASAQAPVPTTFELVAVGKRSGAKIVWLKPIGDRVWLSGLGLDAYTTGDGPLETSPDLLLGLKYTAKHHIDVTYAGTTLFALRHKTEAFGDAPDPPAIFVRDGTRPWAPASPLVLRDKVGPQGDLLGAHAFVRWQKSAVFMYSQAQGVSFVRNYPKQPGTTFLLYSQGGEVSETKFDIPRPFMAWDMDSDGERLAVLGHVAEDGHSRRVSVYRGDGLGPLKEAAIVERPAEVYPAELFAMRVREQGRLALVWLPVAPASPSLLFMAGTALVVDEGPEGIPRTKRLAFSDGKHDLVKEAAAVGNAVYAVMQGANERTWLARIGDDDKRDKVTLPGLALNKEHGGFRAAKDGEIAAIPCSPVGLFAQRENDLWLEASCAGSGVVVPAVFRLGHAQEPIGLP